MSKKRSEPAKDAIDRNRLDAGVFITMAARFVSYQGFYEDCGVDEFRVYLGLAVYDLFTATTEDMKARNLGVRPAERLAGYRTSAGRTSGKPVYPRVVEVLRARAAELALPATLDEWAEKLEDIASRDLAHLAMAAPIPRDRLAATEAILDRRSAKRGREVSPTVLILPDRLADELRAGLGFLAEHRPAGEIDAGKLNVPRLVGQGDTSHGEE